MEPSLKILQKQQDLVTFFIKTFSMKLVKVEISVTALNELQHWHSSTFVDMLNSANQCDQIWQFIEAYPVVGKILNLLCQICNVFGQIFIVANNLSHPVKLLTDEP